MKKRSMLVLSLVLGVGDAFLDSLGLSLSLYSLRTVRHTQLIQTDKQIVVKQANDSKLLKSGENQQEQGATSNEQHFDDYRLL